MKLPLPILRLVLLLLVTPLLCFAQNSSSSLTNYTRQLNEQLTQARQPHLLVFSADWCPTCKYQHKLIQEILKEPEFRDFVVVEVDFDLEEELKTKLSVRRQGTIIARRGDTELQREVLARDDETIRTLMRVARAQAAATE